MCRGKSHTNACDHRLGRGWSKHLVHFDSVKVLIELKSPLSVPRDLFATLYVAHALQSATSSPSPFLGRRQHEGSRRTLDPVHIHKLMFEDRMKFLFCISCKSGNIRDMPSRQLYEAT